MADDRIICGSIITFTTPEYLVSKLDIPWFKEKFNKVLIFRIPDSYGEFPDTTGYENSDWQNLETQCEDPALFKYMQRAIDAVIDYNDKKIRQYEKRGWIKVEGILQAPKFGAKIFCASGIVKALPSNIVLTPRNNTLYQAIN